MKAFSLKNKIFFALTNTLLFFSFLLIGVGYLQLEINFSSKAKRINDSLMESLVATVDTRIEYIKNQQSVSYKQISAIYEEYLSASSEEAKISKQKIIEAELRQTTYVNDAIAFSFITGIQHDLSFYSSKDFDKLPNIPKILNDFPEKEKTTLILKNLKYFDAANGEYFCFIYRCDSSVIATLIDTEILFNDADFSFAVYGEDIRYTVGNAVNTANIQELIDSASAEYEGYYLTKSVCNDFSVLSLTEKSKITGKYSTLFYLPAVIDAGIIVGGIIAAFFIGKKLTDFSFIFEQVDTNSLNVENLQIKKDFWTKYPIRKQFNLLSNIVILTPISLILCVSLICISAFGFSSINNAKTLFLETGTSNMEIINDTIDGTMNHFLYTDSLQQVYYDHYDLEYAEWSNVNVYYKPTLTTEDFKAEMQDYDLNSSMISNYVFFDTDFNTLYYSTSDELIPKDAPLGYFVHDGSLFYMKKVTALYKTKERGSAEYLSTALRPLGYVLFKINIGACNDKLSITNSATDISYYITLGDKIVYSQRRNAAAVNLSDLTNDKNYYYQPTENMINVLYRINERIDFNEYFVIIFTTSLTYSFIALLTYVFSKKIAGKYTEEIKRLTASLDGVSYSDSILTDEYQINEVKQLQSSFNNMLMRIDKLSHEITRNKLRIQRIEKNKKEAELIAYQQQIHPHFLSNAFVTASIMVKNNHPNALSFITSIAKMLDLSLFRNKVVVPLAEEIEHLKAYLKIQEIRFQGDISVTLNQSPSTKNKYTMKLLLQPVIENNFMHGIEPIGHGKIDVDIYMENDNLVYKIKDDGVGISEEKLREIRENLNVNNSASHLGLVNVNTRIKLNCGEQYGLKVDSLPGEGTLIIITLPGNLTPNYETENDNN